MGWIWVPSPREGRLVPNRPAPGLPLCRGGWNLGGFHRISCRVPATLFSQRHLPNSRHHYFTQDAPVLARRAGKKPGGASEEKRGRGKGKRRRRRRHHARSFANPRGHHPIPFTGQNPSNLLAFPRRFIRNSPLDVPLNKTIRSKTRKPRLLLESPISPFATWIPVLQECEAAKSEPVILFR